MSKMHPEVKKALDRLECEEMHALGLEVKQGYPTMMTRWAIVGVAMRRFGWIFLDSLRILDLLDWISSRRAE